MAWFVVVPQTGEIFSEDVQCETKSDHLVTMHTSDHRRSVWYGGQTSLVRGLGQCMMMRIQNLCMNDFLC